MKKLILLLFCLIQLALAQAPKELKPIIEVRDKKGDTRFGEYTMGVGDINKDGYADVVVSAPVPRLSYLYYGGNPMDTLPAKVFNSGGRIASGDFNGDGWIDLAIELFFHDTVQIYYGGEDIDTIPDVILHAENVSTRNIEGYGFSLRANDLNGDGITDLIISAAYNTYINDSTLFRGKIYLYQGTTEGLDTIPVWTVVGDTVRAGLGYDIAIGDINNDGKKDIIALGYLGYNNETQDEIFYIKIFINEGNFNFKEEYYIDSRNTAGGFREHIESFDEDGDGIDDILVNRVFIFKGGKNFNTTPTYYVPPPYGDTTMWGPWPVVSGGGDYNGDGIKDILLSTTLPYSHGTPGVTVYLGGINKAPQFVAYRSFTEWGRDELYRPHNAGDVNGDGVDDIIIGGIHSILPTYGLFGIYSGDTSLVTGIKRNNSTTPKDFELGQNYPNPFNPETTIEYTLNKRERITIKIYDTLGREVKTLINNEEQSAGNHTIKWNGTNEKGERLSSGIYYYQLLTGSQNKVKKAVLLK